VSEVVSPGVARLAFLSGQGLLQDPTAPATPSSIFRMIEKMGFVQLDSINVVERAHHLTLASRFDAYRPSMLDALFEKKRRLFEHWTHDASAIPVDLFPHWHHRFAWFRERLGKNKWWKKRIGGDERRLIESVLAEIQKHGEMMSKDFVGGESKNEHSTGWWGWKREKAALEYLWWTGRLAVARRVGFQKVYDLVERVLGAHAERPASDPKAHVEWACRSALERLEFATPAEIAGYWDALDVKDARAWCAAAHQRGEVELVTLGTEDGSRPRPAYVFVDWRKRARAETDVPDRMRLLSPFDPIVRDRKRASRLFAFDYRFEAFTPEPQRKFGYYVLPIFERDRFVGRVDPKFHREPSELEIRRVFWESGVRVTKARRRALEAAVDRLAGVIGAKSTKLPR
jgi:uncharacterized protein YcaQ